MKKILSVLLSLTTVFLFFSVITANASIDDGLRFYSIINEKPSCYGYSDYKIIDENGTVLERSKESYLPEINLFSLINDLPEQYDSREYGYVTDIKYQGESGICWAFSSISALESDCIANGYDTLENTDYSEAHLAWFSGKSLTDNVNDPTYGDGINYDSPYLIGGNWRIATAPLARWSGIANEVDFPFNGFEFPSVSGFTEEHRYNNETGKVINSAEIMLNMNDTKQWIIDHGSVTAAFYYTDEFYNSNTASHYNNQSTSINHQINIIGWDDNYSASNFTESANPPENGAWLCKNSWSNHWGNNGYFWISYYDTSLNYFAGFTAKEISKNDNNYTYNGTIFPTYFTHTSTVQCANVFKTKSCEKLKAVSIYTMTDSCDVTVSIYKDIKSNYTNPTQGTLVLKDELFIDREGYHTINLSKSIQLLPNSVFSVIVECYNQNGESIIPFEYQNGDVNYFAKEGESYICLGNNTTSWIDNTQRGWGNLYIQAFTENHHSFITESIPPTCQNEGSETTFCEYCNTVIEKNTFNKTEHKYGEWTEFTPDAKGISVSKKICSECGDSITRINRPGKSVDFREFFEILIKLIKTFFTINKNII